jgi:hypothetical protein
MKIEKISINGDTIARAITQNYYPPSGNINLNAIITNKWYNYLVLFGIRVSTCDTSMPDDLIGGIRLRKPFFGGIFGGDYWEICVSNGSTDPSPYWITNPLSDAARYGGTAWVKEGQYLYRKRNSGFEGYPAFEPINPINVYRWSPTKAQIQDAKAKKLDLSVEFEIAKNSGQIIESTSNDTLIHRTWSNKLYKDSAGCQVFGDNDALITLSSWASQHRKIYKSNSFSYTLLTKDQFVNPNKYTLGSVQLMNDVFKIYSGL